VVNVLSQVLLPPAYIAFYGIGVYGEWLTLSAAAAWLLTLDFGLQSFITNALCIEYNRGNLERFRQMQSVALRICLGIVTAGLLAGAGILATFSLNEVLGLAMTRFAASAIAIGLTTQVLIGIVWGQLNGLLVAVGYPHRSQLWAQTQRLLYFCLTCLLVFCRAPLWSIPPVQLLTFILMAAISLVDLRRLAPEAFPTIGYWDGAVARTILKPSLWFGAFTLNQFLLFQSPILVLNQMLGKQAVVVFSICRALFGMVRQAVSVLRLTVRPEITRLAGAGDQPRLRRVYDVYEKCSFAAGLVGSVLAFLAAPRILPIWTRRPDLFDQSLYAAMMLSTIVIVGKDTRLDLQYATNRHIRSAAVCLFSYCAFAAGTIPAVRVAGPLGIAVLWTAAEVVQMIFIQRENREILPNVSAASLLKLCACGLAALAILVPFGHSLTKSSWNAFVLWFGVATVASVAAASFTFGLTGPAGRAYWALKPMRRSPLVTRAE
jgi:O-antigen/teichoic acid export membrane protein